MGDAPAPDRFMVVTWKDEIFVHDILVDTFATAESWCREKSTAWRSGIEVRLADWAWYATPRDALRNE